LISVSNIQQNLTCADLRYSPRLTIRYNVDTNNTNK
jgi:hypothetical protein